MSRIARIPAASLLAMLVGCGPGGEPPPVPPVERVLEGPLVGAGLAVIDGATWVSAPGAGGEGRVARLDRISGDVGLEAAAVTVSGDGLSGAFAWCPSWNGAPALAVGAPDLGDRGRAWLVPDPSGETRLGDQASTESRENGAHTGAAMACGDLDGDDRAELAVSAPDTAVSFPEAGTVTLHRDEAGALDTFASVDTSWANARLGFRTGLLAGADLDADGLGDLVAAGAGADRVHVLPGPLQGSYLTNSYGLTLQGEEGDASGYALATGDLTGDGAVDLVIGAPEAGNGKGRVWVVPGPIGEASAGLLRNVALSVEGVSQGAQVGFSVAVPGDVDADGRDDLLIGAPFAGGVGEEAGAAYLVLASSIGEIASVDEADAILLGDVAFGRLGWAVAGGDVDGDGAIELLVSAPEADVDGGVGVGQVWVFGSDARGTTYPEVAEARVHR